MGHPYLQSALLILSALALCFSQGSGRVMMLDSVPKYDVQVNYMHEIRALSGEVSSRGRETAEFLMDYNDPGANTNPRSGALFAPPPPLH
ncbi:hypothetical protein AMTRI_Chr04g190460 [Amborella trichopoda]|uniref:Uncharacterized protein n=1 Tax=Amborella trichopoda TaxID=13333 RepID=W1NGA4_AMBTC|nr:hypothetical protein AMTR_s00010p00264140 [Amborella trichopoda]